MERIGFHIPPFCLGLPMAPARDARGRFTSPSAGGDTNIGTAYGQIVLDASSVAATVNSATQSLGGFFTNIGSRMQAFGQSMAGAGASLVGITAPFLAIGKVGLDTAADFDVLLKQIELFGGVAPEQMETVRQFAMQMGQDTKFSNNEAAAAMLDLLKSGMSLEEAMAALRPVLDSATVGNLGLAEAAGYVSSGLAQFNLDATQAARVSNAMAAAANVSRAEIRDIGQAMQNVGPVAAQYGLQVEDVAGILAVFADNGIMGAEAGTQLKSMLLNLSRPTDSVKGAFERLGVSMYNSDGSLRNFNTVLLELDSALDRLPMEEQNELAQILAGSYGIMGFQALRAAGGINETLTAMQEAPSAASLAEQFMNTFRGSMESLTGSGETFLTEFLTPFMNNVAGPFVQRLTEIINGLTDWARANPELTQTIATVVLAVAGLGAGMAAIGGVLAGAGTVIGFIGTALAALMSPIGLIIAAIVGLGLAFSTNFLGIQDLLAGIWAVVQPSLQQLYDWFMTDGLAAIKDFIEQTVVPGVQAFVDILEGIWIVVQPALQSLYDWFVTTGLPAMQIALNAIKVTYIDPFIASLQNIWTTISPGLTSMVNWFRDTFQYIGTNYIQPVLDFIGSIFTKAQEALDLLRQLGGGAPNVNLINQNSQSLGLPTIPMRDSGGPGLAGMPYLIGRQQVGNEVFVPESNGTFIPNMGKMLDALANGMGQSGDTFNVTVNANDRAGGQAAGDAFVQRITELRYARGNRG